VPISAGKYTLSESGPAGFTNDGWECLGASLDGATLTIATGAEAICAVNNTAIAPTLTLVKQVDNGSTGAGWTSSDWTLTANGPAVVSGASGTDPVTAVAVPVGAYILSESGPVGYAASAWSCQGATVADGTITLAEGQNAICTVTNTAVAPTLTLVKQVDNQHGGTATPADFTLTATGPTTITGTTGSTDITSAKVVAGSYTLSESGGPSGYQASVWSCNSGTQSRDVVTVALGDHITCTLVNHDQPGSNPPPAGPGSSSGGGLPGTGSNASTLLWLALILMTVGAGAVLLARVPRRTT
jgi:hypothetical protein